MKIKFVNIAIIKDAELELGDFNLFLGLPSTGKSFALKAIHSSLIFADEIYELPQLRDKMLSLVNTGTDILISYILSLKDRYNVLHETTLKNLLKVINEGNKFNITASVEDNKIIIQEKFNIIPELKKAMKTVQLDILKGAINYSNSSKLYIDGAMAEDIIDSLDISFSYFDVNCANLSMHYTVNGYYSYTDNQLIITTKINLSGERVGQKLLKEDEIRNMGTPRIETFIIKNVFYDKMFLVMDKFKERVGVKNVLFIPNERLIISQLIDNYQSLPPEFHDQLYMLFEHLGVSTLSYMLSLDRVKSPLENGLYDMIRNKEILRIIQAITGAEIVSEERSGLKFKINGSVIEPKYVSSMINEVFNILLPLADVQTPALVLIEEPESQLHLAYQILLLLAMLSLVQHGYKFVVSTHSDLMASFLGDLDRYKPSKEKVVDLIKKIFNKESLSPTIEKVIEEAVKTINENKIKTFYFENRTVSEFPTKELAYRVPTVTKEVIDRVIDWEFELKEESNF